MNPLEFDQVVRRVKLAMGASPDYELAALLGFDPRAWSKRRERRSLPTRQIDALIAREGLNAEWVYHGVGAMHRVADEPSNEGGVLERLRHEVSRRSALILCSGDNALQRDLQDVLDGVQPVTPALLRRMRLTLRTDLNWLLCGEEPLSEVEKKLVAQYRNAGAVGQRALEAVSKLVGEKA